MKYIYLLLIAVASCSSIATTQAQIQERHSDDTLKLTMLPAYSFEIDYANVYYCTVIGNQNYRPQYAINIVFMKGDTLDKKIVLNEPSVFTFRKLYSNHRVTTIGTNGFIDTDGRLWQLFRIE